MANNTLTRIYQGRVKQVSINGKSLSPEDGDNLIWKHHELFQDAVNYYLVALAGMADPRQDKTPCAKFRKAVESTWNGFVRNGVVRPGMKESLARTLQCDSATLTFQSAVDQILGENHAPIEVLDAGLQNIAGSLKGDVVQPAGKYLPQLCFQEYSGNFDFSSNMNAGRTGMNKMLDLLQTTDATEAQRKYNTIKNEIQLTWVGQKTQEVCYTLVELKETAKEMIAYFLAQKNASSTPPELANAIDISKMSSFRERTGEITRTDIQKTGTGPKNNNLVYATLLLMCFGDISLLSIINTQRKTLEKKKKDWGDSSKCENNLPDDPIKLSRGNRGYTFPFFTKLQCWSKQWSEFDKEAFIEALKTLNQFQDKIATRQKQLEQINKCIIWMRDGVSSDGKPPKPPTDDSEGNTSEEENDEVSTILPILKGDPRWLRLQAILHDDLQIKNDLTNDEIMDYGLSERTIRGASPIFKEWNEILKKSTASDVEKELRNALTRFQAENSQTIGSAPLFLELTKKQNHCIWDNHYQSPQKYASMNILEDAVTYYDFLDEAEFLDEPIKFSPADALHSRRLSNFKVLSGQKQSKQEKRMTWGTGFGLHGNDLLDVPVAIQQENGKWSPTKVTLTYSAPRLLRDQLIHNGIPMYCPPLVQAFNVFDNKAMSPTEDAKRIATELRDAAVQLMPDYDRKGKLRLLLNFQPAVDIEDIRKNTADVFSEKYFYGGKDEKFCLRWPDYDKPQSLWCDSAQPFDIVSVDLGQRTAGALSRIRISMEQQARSIYIGNDGKRNWFAKQVYGGLLRLPGEDCKTKDGKDELSGSAGRLATPSETEEAKAIATEILGDEETVQKFLVADMTPEGTLVYKKYYPTQNDCLLRILKRGIYRLRQLARWHFFWKNGEEAKVLEEAKDAPWLQDKTLPAIQKAELEMRDILKTNLLRITERILPLRGRHWELKTAPQGNSLILAQTTPSPLEPKRWICGQRGLSFSRLEQLENLRHCFQSINRILMDAPGSKRKTAKELRGISIPDCCPDILMRLDELKEQRVNQTANMILAQALGLKHKEHDTGARNYREENNIHGEYEQIPGLSPAKFIVIENLSRYRFSQGRSKFENSRLMKWSHRAIRDKLKMLCEVYGITVVEVNASYSSKFSPEGIPGFRAEELPWQDIRKSFFYQKNLKENTLKEKELKQELELLIAEAEKKGKTLLMPKQGGPIFIPFQPEGNDNHFAQADVNASYNLGLRAVAHLKVQEIHHKLSIEKTKLGWKFRNTSNLGKKVLPKSATFEIEAEHLPSSEITNLFVCGCPCRNLGLSSAKNEGDFEEYNGRMMIGGGIWSDKSLELKRCLEINRKRL